KLISNEFFSVQRYLKAYLIKKKFYKYFSLFLSLIKIKTFLQVFIFPIKSIHLGLQRSIEIEMMTTKRFEKAVTKLYKAFHDDKLNPECCKQCAVGNICDNFDAWRYFTDSHGGTTLNYVGKVNEAFGKRINGYLPSELLKI